MNNAISLNFIRDDRNAAESSVQLHEQCRLNVFTVRKENLRIPLAVALEFAADYCATVIITHLIAGLQLEVESSRSTLIGSQIAAGWK